MNRKGKIITIGVSLVLVYIIYSIFFGERAAVDSAYKHVNLPQSMTLTKKESKSTPLSCFDNCPTNVGVYYFYTTSSSRGEIYSSLEQSFQQAGYEIREEGSAEGVMSQSEFVAWGTPVSFIVYVQPTEVSPSSSLSKVSQVVVWGSRHG